MKHMFCLLLALWPCFGQAQLLFIEERNDDGKSGTIKTARRIVDLNSSLHLTINKKALTERIARDRPPALLALGDQLIGRMEDVRKLLQFRRQTDSLYRKAMSDYAQSPTVLFAGYSQFVSNISAATKPVLMLLTNYPEIRQRYDKAIELADDFEDPLVQNELAFTAAEEVVREWEGQLEQQLRDEGAYVQMGAWLVRPSGELPLHLEGFDAYEVGSRYVIDRFVIALTDAQKEQLQTAVTAAKALNRALEQDNQDMKPLLTFKKKIISAYKGTASYKAIDTLRRVVAQLRTTHSTNPGFLRLLDPLTQQVAGYQAAVGQIVKLYENPADTALTPDELLIRSNGDLIKLTTTTKTLLTQLTGKHIPQLQRDIVSLGTVLKNDAQRVFDTAIRVQKAVETDVSRVTGTINDFLQAFQRKSFNATTLRFTEKVAKIALDKLPVETDLHIVNAGVRDKGDLIIVRIGAGFGEGAVRYLETHQFPLYKVLPHIETTVGIILADPVSSEYLVTKSKFQVAASYSVLAKGFFDRRWRQRSSAYHTLVDIGIGLNVCAPDFDRDGIPELGVGLVLSLFRDYVQGGIGYNVFLDKRYGFFGLRLPLPSFSLVGSGNDKTP